MTTYAGRPVFPPYFVDTSGNPQELVSITIYNRGTVVKPSLYTSRTKATPLANPFTADSLGNAEFYLDPGEYDALVNGITLPFSVVPDPVEPISGAAVVAAIPSGTYVPTGLVLNVKDFAATGAQRAVLGNALPKPLSGFYGALPAAQADYPQATALTDQLDWAVSAKAVEAAKISGANGAKAVVFPNGKYIWGDRGVVLDHGIVLRSITGIPGWGGISAPVTIEGSGAGTILIDTPSTYTQGCGVVGIELSGSSTAKHAIRFRNVFYGRIESVFAAGFTHQGILQDAGQGCTFDRVNTQSCLLSPGVLADYMGALDVSGTDHWATRCEIASYPGATTGPLSASAYYVAIRWNATHSFLFGMIGETSDCGWAVTGNSNRFVACRGDANWGGDWIISGSGNKFSSCDGANSAKAATATYDSFTVTGGGNSFGECSVDSSAPNNYRVGFADTPGLAQRNRYSTSCWINLVKVGRAFPASLDADAVGEWQTPTLINSWAVVDEVVRFRREGDLIHVMGSVDGGATGSYAFVLPPRYRPAGLVLRPTSAGGEAGRLYVDSAGQVAIYNAFGTASTDAYFDFTFVPA